MPSLPPECLLVAAHASSLPPPLPRSARAWRPLRRPRFAERARSLVPPRPPPPYFLPPSSRSAPRDLTSIRHWRTFGRVRVSSHSVRTTRSALPDATTDATSRAKTGRECVHVCVCVWCARARTRACVHVCVCAYIAAYRNERERETLRINCIERSLSSSLSRCIFSNEMQLFPPQTFYMRHAICVSDERR